MNDNLLTLVTNGMHEALAPARRRISELYDLDMNEHLLDEPPQRDRRQIVASLVSHLSAAKDDFAMYLEMCGLPATRQHLLTRWEQLNQNLGETKWHHGDESDDLSSPAADLLEQVYWGLRQMLPDKAREVQSETSQAVLMRQFVYALKHTAVILKNHRVVPRTEQDVKSTMTKHLETVFEDYVTTPMIPKPIVNFKPDGGVVSLRSAVEFKFCRTKDEVKNAIHGLTEDLGGYSGSRDWEKFFTVLYQTEVLTTEPRCQSALRHSGMDDRWTLMVVTGDKDAPVA